MAQSASTAAARDDDTSVRDGRSFLHAVEASLRWLEINASAVDRLNVFPVPDGDTGTNMMLTLRAALEEASAEDSPHIGDVARAVARGALLGARGNSGVIFSQLLRGVSERLDGLHTFGPREFARALERGYEVAYESVTNPVEGTMLTVARDGGQAAIRAGPSVESHEELVAEVVQAMHDSVQNTPNQLPVLKEAGVVDAGGQGLYVIFDGMLRHLRGEELPEVATEDRAVETFAAFADAHSLDEQGYCTEFLIHGDGLDVEEIRAYMADVGQSVLVVGDVSLIRVHVHTESPGDVLNYALQRGQVDKVKADNMDLQQADAFAQARRELGEQVEVARAPVIAVAVGAGMQEVFASLGAAVVAGGQSMNPSAGDILAAIETTPEEWAVVLPNNSNVQMAARQAAEQSEKDVRIVPTRTVPEGIAAMIAFNGRRPIDDNLAAMTRAASEVTTIEITRAVRDAVVGDVRVKKGEHIGLLDDELIAGDSDPNVLVLRLLDRLADSEPELATVYIGADTAEETADKLVDEIGKAHPDLEVETVQGGQALYDYVISIE